MTFNRSQSGITSPAKIIANIFISFIGAGLLGLPYAFKESGVMEGAIIMSIVGYLSVSAMLMLIDCKYALLSNRGISGGQSFALESKTPLIPTDSSEEEFDNHKVRVHDLTYGDLGSYAMGVKGKKLVDITIVASQVGFCCGYLIYLCENLNEHIKGLSRGQWLFLILPPLYLLTLLRHLNKLAVFSIFAQISNVFALTVVFWFDFSHSEEVEFRVKEFSIKGLPFFFAVSIYCYEGAGMILSLEESVASLKKPMFRPVFVATMIVLTILYITFGASGYLSFGPHTEEIITLNLPTGKSAIDFAALVKICLGVALFFTYPMMLFPVTHLIDKFFGFQKDVTKGNMVRLLVVITTGLVVIAIPNFAILAGLIGATCCTLLAFILPAAFHLAIFKGRLTSRQKYFDFLLIFLGVTGSIVGLWDALQRIYESPVVDVGKLSQHQLFNLSSVLKNTTQPPVAFIHPTTLKILLNNSKLLQNKELNIANISTLNLTAVSPVGYGSMRSNITVKYNSNVTALPSYSDKLYNNISSQTRIFNNNFKVTNFKHKYTNSGRYVKELKSISKNIDIISSQNETDSLS